LRNRTTDLFVQVDRIICHRKDSFTSQDQSDVRPSQFLVLWKTGGDPARAAVSWHKLAELSSVLHLVQRYITDHEAAKKSKLLQSSHAGKKRKYPFDVSRSHLPTPPGGRSATSREGSIVTISSDGSDGKISEVFTDVKPTLLGPDVYNAVFKKREGLLTPLMRSGPTFDATTLPTQAMVEESYRVDTIDAQRAIRRRYEASLQKIPGPPVAIVNELDNETPDLGFKFVSEYVLHAGVERQDVETITGCDQCKPNMGANRGCEYTKKCGCLEFAQPDEQRMTDEQRKQWIEDPFMSTEGFPKHFPYYSSGPRTGCLVDTYLHSRQPIYECNSNCACGRRCKNRNVQHGRKVRLEIFKTHDRGFGLRCLENLQKGQFLDTYLGEIIDDSEADRRESMSGTGKASYLFALDKFVEDLVDGFNRLKDEDCYVVDGQFMGTPTRFINHCCQPNVQMHTVSYNKYDLKVYDLAFFAKEHIPAGTELTFDYMDVDDSDKTEDDQEALSSQHGGKAKVPCHCGAESCRGFLWT